MTIQREAPLKPPLNPSTSPTNAPTAEQIAAAPPRVRAAYSGLAKWEARVGTLRQWKVFLKATHNAVEEEIADLRKELADEDLYYQTKMQHERRLDQLRDTLSGVVNGDPMEGEFPLIIQNAHLPEAVRAHRHLGMKLIGPMITEAKAERDKRLAIIDEWVETLPTPPTQHVLRQTTRTRVRQVG